MNLRNRNCFHAVVCFCCGALFLFVGTASVVALTPPLYITTEAKITDGWGGVLQGNCMDPEERRDRFEIRYADSGVIYAPASDGTADERNPLVENGVSTIGSGVGSQEVRPGIFSVALLQGRPMPGDQIFIRVYDAPEITGAVHYVDSQVITVPSDADAVCYACFGSMLPLDTNDSDGDSLPDSFEERLGSDAFTPDTDGDGMTDAAEFRAGTDINDMGSLLALETKNNAENGQVECRWQAVQGMRYQLQYRPSMDDAFADTGAVQTASSEMLVLNIPLPDDSCRGQFRLRLVEN